MEHGEFEKAVKFFEESSKLDPRFKTLELQGECLMKLGKGKQAIIPLAAAVGLGTRPFRALFLLAQALHTIGANDSAIGKLDMALELQPDYKAAQDLRATIAGLK